MSTRCAWVSQCDRVAYDDSPHSSHPRLGAYRQETLGGSVKDDAFSRCPSLTSGSKFTRFGLYAIRRPKARSSGGIER